MDTFGNLATGLSTRSP